MLKTIKRILSRKTPAPTVEAAPTVETPIDPAKIEEARAHHERSVAKMLAAKNRIVFLPGKLFPDCGYDNLALTNLIILNQHRTQNKTICKMEFTPYNAKTGKICNAQPTFTINIDDVFSDENRAEIFYTLFEVLRRYLQISLSDATAHPREHTHISL
jgi:hypothetical protein